MEFRLLGPLEVFQDGKPVRLGGGKQRALLACLLVHANQVTSTDRLIDDLWGDHPPETAGNTLQVYIGRLRKILQPGGGDAGASDRLQTRPPGYLLQVGEEEFDVFRFERLVEEGRRFLASDAERAAARLRDALALWRGAALADFAGEPFAAAEATRLEELRVSALEDRIDADLALGHHREVVAELEGLVALYPLRERLRGQLMLALYQAGRQAEACRLYDATRTVLRDELGVEPSPQLQTLFKQVLNQDPALGAAAEPAGERSGHNLPAELTSFVGREHEVGEVSGLLRRGRLVTLTGAGGSGKTRLALRVAAELLKGSGGGVWLVELAPVGDPRLVPQTVGAVLGIRERSGQAMTETLVERLSGQPVVLVIDNCEHVVESCAQLAHSLLAGGVGLRILATSREPLNVPGEIVWRVPPLALPDPDAGGDPAALAGYAAIRLFADRAAAVRPNFVVDKDNAAAVAAICRRLDGIPLAIELASARTRTMSVEEILRRLDRCFGLLTGGARTALPRQQTLRATVDWSYGLLTPDEQVLFRRLAVFAGGWGLADAESVCAGGDLAEPDVLDVLDHLVDRSLVVAEPGPEGTTRYGMLETLREYALERLREADEEEALRARHFAHFLVLVEAAQRQKLATGSDSGLPGLTLNQDNLRAALGWARSADPAGTLRMAAGLLDFWLSHNMTEGRRWLEESLTRAAARTEHRAGALLAAGTLATLHQSYDDARRLLEEAVDISLEVGDRRGEAWARTGLGWLLWAMDDPAAARDELERSVPVHEALGDRFGLARALTHLGVAMSLPETLTEGRQHLERGVAMAEEFGDRWGTVYGLFMLGWADIDAGAYESARRRFRRAVEARVGTFMAAPMEGLAYLGADEDPERTMRLLGAAMAIRARFGGRPPPSIVRRVDRLRERATEQLGADDAERAWNEGHRMTTEAAYAYALGEPPAPCPATSGRERRTFMFTDIVRSTNLVEAIGDEAWDHLLRWHDDTLRSLVARHGGEAVKGTGDGFFVAFADTDAAAHCAVDIQRCLDRHRVEHGFAPDVRIGLHEADATRRDGDYHGRGVHIAARIAALAGPGEILASPAVAASIGPSPASQIRTVRLRGVSAPVDVVAIPWRDQQPTPYASSDVTAG